MSGWLDTCLLQMAKHFLLVAVAAACRENLTRKIIHLFISDLQLVVQCDPIELFFAKILGNEWYTKLAKIFFKWAIPGLFFL